MTNPTGAELIAPLRPQYITGALEIARANPDSFRREQLEWLLTHHPLRHAEILKMYQQMYKSAKKQARAEPYMMGSVLGDGVVRLCVEDTGVRYDELKENYQRNSALIAASPEATTGLSTQEKLQALFAPEIADTLLSIKHTTSCETAAATIGSYCLRSLPISEN